MASMTETRQANLESSLLFMQQEHAATLKALHDEIHKLQKKCSELTFQVAMQTTSSSDEESSARQIKSLESDISKKTKQNKDLIASLEKRDGRILILEQKIKAQEKKYQDELKGKNKQIITLRGQLETTSGNVAELSMQIRNIKVSRSREFSDTERSSHSPLPPREGSKHERRRSYKRIVAADAGHIVPHPPSTPRGSRTYPDPAPFLEAGAKEPVIHVRPRSDTKPLPPIGGTLCLDGEASEIPSPRHAQSNAFVRRAKLQRDLNNSSASLQQEVETLAVDQVKTRDHSLRHAQEYNSSD